MRPIPWSVIELVASIDEVFVLFVFLIVFVGLLLLADIAVEIAYRAGLLDRLD